jgi:tetratricopeptide (TPR) repeat protein
LALLLLGLFGAGWPHTAHAADGVQAPSDENAAREALRRGMAAYARGDAEGALAEYETAKRLAPLANAPYQFAAQALESLGRWPEVVANLEQYLAKNPNVSNAGQIRARIAKVRADHFPGHLRIDGHAGAALTIDGESRGVLPAKVDLLPGKHRVEVADAGTKDVTIKGDEEAALVFDDKVEPQAPPASPPPAPPPAVHRSSPSSSASPYRTLGWILAGTGAATLITSFIVDLAVLGPKIDDYEAAADQHDPRARQLRDEAAGLRTGLVIGYAAGAILAAGGGGLVVFAPRASHNSAGLSARITF